MPNPKSHRDAGLPEELVRAVAAPQASPGRLQRLAKLQALLSRELLAEVELLDYTTVGATTLAERRTVAPAWLPEATGKSSERHSLAASENRRYHSDHDERPKSANDNDVPTPQAEFLTSDELANRLNVKTRQTVHDWRSRGTVVGWQGAKRGYVYPARQIDSRGLPLPHVAQVISVFGDHHSAWEWLTTPHASLNGAEPLHLLRAGLTDAVLSAARKLAPAHDEV